MDNLHVVNLSSYNRPKIKEDKKRKWVAYGDDNNYYQYLIELYTNSTTNNAIINGVSNLIYGKGLDALDSSTKTDEYAALRSIIHKDCLKKVALDLKMLGEASFQVLYQGGRVVRAEHFPRQTLRAETYNDKGEIEAYYYHHDWSKVKPNDKPRRIAAFGYGNGKEPEIKMVKKYVSGYNYYCPVDYQGGLAYAELESEIADYLINDVQNGFSGTKVVNFNNGVPDREKQLQIKSDVMQKLTGSRGEKVIIAFNNNAETKTTIDDVPLDNAPAHYEYLSSECATKLMVAHRVTSPLLLGIRDGNNGLGNNADEIKTASLLFQNVTIRPYQDLIIDCIDQILAVNNISLKLYFKTLQPLEFIETDNAVTDEAREEETGVKLATQVVSDSIAVIDDRLAYSTQEKAEEMALDLGCSGFHTHELDGKTWYMPCEQHNLSKDDRPFLSEEEGNELLKILDEIGEEEDPENYELLDVESAEDEPADFDAEKYLNSLVTLSATQDSDQDNEMYKVRYKYVKGTRKQPKSSSRRFCQDVLSRGFVYRKEDILALEGQNTELGHQRQPYSIWMHKGGVNCYHIWERRIYKKRLKKDGTPWGGDALQGTSFVNVNQAVREGFSPEVNDRRVAEAQIDRADKGHHPNYRR